ncbi:hypothetical protein [Halostagnicola kamekurae]|uniref:Uncharacterized protein n=1 Tax=Halostagnicola kamekurae TaxID=619731 RepID=A0A1I6V949_9EURY|nr:hypothetical protein [Halostagnicola kamekurae]SFT10211.1 hypothetical protein SAMN04488556_0145 [Halostagnicola kamekurae]
MVRRNNIDRRTAIKGIGGFLSLGILPATSAAASSAESAEQPESKFNIVDGQVVVDEDVTGEAAEASQQTADTINTGIENGHLTAFEENGEVMVEPVESSRDDNLMSTQSVMSTQAGQNDLSWDQNGITTSITLKMNDELTDTVVIILAGGAAVSAATSAVLGASGIGAVPAAISGVISAALGFFATVLSVKNDGSGVAINFKQRPFLPNTGSVSTR